MARATGTACVHDQLPIVTLYLTSRTLVSSSDSSSTPNTFQSTPTRLVLFVFSAISKPANLSAEVPQYKRIHELDQLETCIKMVFLNLLTFGLWGKLGRLGHYALDAVLISTILAGMRRSTGLTVKSERIHESGEVNKWVNKYLGVGEWVLDQSVAFAGSSKFFERTR